MLRFQVSIYGSSAEFVGKKTRNYGQKTC